MTRQDTVVYLQFKLKIDTLTYRTGTCIIKLVYNSAGGFRQSTRDDSNEMIGGG